MKIAYVFFDLPYAPYPGWEWRVAELLEEKNHAVFPVPKHRTIMENNLMIPTDIDIIYTSNPMALDIAVELKKRLNKPLVVQFLDIPNALFGSEPWRIKEYEKVKELVDHADCIVSISETTAKDVKKWCGRNSLVNYLGVDEDVFNAFIPEEGKYVGAVVRGLAKQKRHNDVIHAVKNARNQIPLFLIFGQVSDARKAKIISKSLFGISMSTFEGFGMYVAEFGYYSKAFIARELPVFKEIYENAIDYVHSIEEMSEKIDMLYSDPEYRRKKGQKLKELISRKKLTLNDHAERLIKILERNV